MKEKNIASRYRAADVDEIRTPEKSLLIATLERGLMDFLGLGLAGESQKTKDAVIEWLMDDEICPFSFAWICEFLSIDHKKLRSIMVTMRGVEIPPHSPSIDPHKRIGLCVRRSRRTRGVTILRLKSANSSVPQTNYSKC